jgi:hypothetical protein
MGAGQGCCGGKPAPEVKVQHVGRRTTRGAAEGAPPPLPLLPHEAVDRRPKAIKR